jgi:hypothetical protein
VYTRLRSPLPRLRAYHEELGALCQAAMTRRDWERVQRLRALRRRVGVAVRWHEEWDGAPPPLPSGARGLAREAG